MWVFCRFTSWIHMLYLTREMCHGLQIINLWVISELLAWYRSIRAPLGLIIVNTKTPIARMMVAPAFLLNVILVYLLWTMIWASTSKWVIMLALTGLFAIIGWFLSSWTHMFTTCVWLVFLPIFEILESKALLSWEQIVDYVTITLWILLIKIWI